MERNKIEDELRKKFDDDYTVKMCTNFVLEFQECFQDIMPAEEVMKRINTNISGNIQIIEHFKNGRLDGKYDENRIIYLKKDCLKNEKYVKYLLFHEMLHAITSVTDENGNEMMDGFLYTGSCGNGFNEAITEYLTQIRNEKLEDDRADLISGDRVVVEQMRRMMSILGENDIIHYYFYEPDKFKDFINNSNMDYCEMEFAFSHLCAQDVNVYSIGNGKKMDNPNNYVIVRDAQTIFNNFCNSIGEVHTLEDFEKKYQIFQTSVDRNHDCISTMLIPYYNRMGKDVDSLLQKGISIEKIKPILEKLHIKFNVFKNMYGVSKYFENDKNQAAIGLSDIYLSNPPLYFRIFASNYAYMLDYFKEMDTYPDDEIYDAFHYALIGSLLKKHPEIDFSDVSYIKVEEPTTKLHCYIFYTSDNKAYGYNAKGKSIPSFKNEENSNVFQITMNKECTLQLILDSEENMKSIFQAKKGFDMPKFLNGLNFQCNRVYSEKSNIEYWIQTENDKTSELTEALNRINSRIHARSGIDYSE